MLRIVVIAGYVVLSCGWAAWADQLTFRNGEGEYHSQIDLCVYNKQFNDKWRTNGVRTDGTLGLDGYDGHSDGVGQSLVRFDNIIGHGTGQIAPGSTIQSATLTLYTRRDTSTDPGSVGRIQAYRMTSPWDTTSDWTAFDEWYDTDGITNAGVWVSTRSDGVSQVDHAPNNIDVTDAVQAWASGATNYGVGLMINTEDAADLSSRSDAIEYRPLLTVNYNVPEPATGLLLCLGGGLVALRRRRAGSPR